MTRWKRKSVPTPPTKPGVGKQFLIEHYGDVPDGGVSSLRN